MHIKIKGLAAVIWIVIWILGVVLAKGFWSTFFAVITMGFWSMYLVAEKFLQVINWI